MPTPRAPATPKIQRWIDLLAALLQRTYPATFEQLAGDVPAYQTDGKRESLMRMFERDKDELRAFGVPIETVPLDDGEQAGYRLRRRDFYLPYLALAESGPRARRGAEGHGWTAAAPLAFEPDELSAVVDAGRRVRALGDPLLREDAESALRKLASQLPVDATAGDDGEHVVPSGDEVDPAVFATLGRALLDRKRVTFDYRAMPGGAASSRALGAAPGEEAPPRRAARREVEPYGLFFLNGHWYLAARDLAREALRNFRLSRMAGVAANRARAQTPDYEVPASFHLQQHARSRRAWELGDHDVVEAVVELRGRSGAVEGAARLGEPVEGAAPAGVVRRRFLVRRPDAFARWLLSFGGDAVPLSPDPLVARYAALVRETLARYGAPSAAGGSGR